ISLLASVVLISLNQTRKKARDAKRIADMKQILTALELFNNDKGHYPGPTSEGVSTSGEFLGDGGPTETALAPYMSSVPKDPLHDGVTYYYSYDPQHCTDVVAGSCACDGPTGAVLSFNKAETTSFPMRKDTCSGGDMG